MSVPSADLAFAAAIRRVVRDLDVVTPAAVEAGVRLVYPRAIVRARELSAEPAMTLYAYRDGSYVPTPTAEWASDDGIAWAAFDPGTGEILEANDAMSQLFGVDGSMVGRFAREFVPEGADAISDEQRTAIAAAGAARSGGLARRADGSSFLVEFVARVNGDRLEGWYRQARAPE